MSGTEDKGGRVVGTRPIIELRGVTKTYGAVAALKGIDLAVDTGEVVGLVGDNGAGKSTLMKIVVGAIAPDDGSILVDGSAVTFAGIRDARRHGIEMLYQDLALCDDLDVAQNFFLGRTPTRFGLVNVGRMHRQVRRQLDELGIQLTSTRVPVRFLSGGQRQSLAIARAVSFKPRLLILDEPTAALGVQQSRAVLDLIRRVRGTTAVVLISHRLQDVLEVCDRVVVLYEGRRVADLRADATSLDEVVTYIVTDPDAARKVARFVA